MAGPCSPQVEYQYFTNCNNMGHQKAQFYLTRQQKPTDQNPRSEACCNGTGNKTLTQKVAKDILKKVSTVSNAYKMLGEK